MYPLDKVLAGSIRGEKADIGSLAAVDDRTAAVMVWNYHDDDVPGTGTEVTINFDGIPKKEMTMTQFRIDDEHSNSYEVWKKMGAPQNPSTAQIAELEKSGQLQVFKKPEKLSFLNGKATVKVMLPTQGVALFKLNW